VSTSRVQESGWADGWISADDNSRLQKTTEHYKRRRKYRKGKLDNISRKLGIFVYSFKRSGTYKRGLADMCRYWKGLWNMDQLENTEEKSFKRESSLTDHKRTEQRVLNVFLFYLY